MTDLDTTLDVPVEETASNRSVGLPIASTRELIDYYDLNDEVQQVIEKENLVPVSLITRLHESFPRYSDLGVRYDPIFKGAKTRYSGLEDFRKLCSILQENGIELGDIQERELFIEVYRFLATKHVLNSIDWNNFEQDSLFQLVFPQPGMIRKEAVAAYLKASNDEDRKQVVVDYMEQTNPHDGKQQLNRPSFYREDGSLETVEGSQHKYPQCFLVFDKTTQSCFAFCSYCFRHAQVRGDEDMFIQDDIPQVHAYLKQHKEITDILITGGDAGFMPLKRMKEYLEPIMTDSELKHIRTIRIASRALTYAPELILSSKYDKIISLFEQLVDHGVQVMWMAHFSTPKELMNVVTIAAVRHLRKHNINIRSQSPMMNHVSLFMTESGKVDVARSAQNWIDLAHIFSMLGIGFHSMYCARPTGEHHYFTAPLADMNKIFSKVYRSLPSISRPSRYITMTSSAGKTSLLGVAEVNGKKAFVLKFNEARNIEWLDAVYLAEYDEEENTIEKLKPFEGDAYFYEEELQHIEKSLEK